MRTFKQIVKEMTTPDHAASVAQFRHSGQNRRFTFEPFISHPNRVAKMVAKFTADKDIISAAQLHDTIEDTPATYEEIEATFGKRVADLVQTLTKNTKAEKKYGKPEYYAHKMNKMSDEELLIKLADRLDNVSDFARAPKKWVQKYTDETLEIFRLMKRSLNPIHKKIIKEIHKKIELGKKVHGIV